MANICSFEMRVKGRDTRGFINALRQRGKYWIGRGAEFDEVIDNGVICLNGWCKWSLASSLTGCANSFKKEPDGWDICDKLKAKEIIPLTLQEACEFFGVEIEAWSDECGMGFAEHIKIKGNEYLINECHDYIEEFDEVSGEGTVTVKPDGFYEFDM